MSRVAKKSKKKIIIIIISILVGILLILGIYLFINNKNDNLKDNNNNKNDNNSNSLIKLIDNLDVEINSEVNLLSFISNIKDLDIVSSDEKIDTSILGEKELIIKYKGQDEEKEYKFIINIKDTTMPVIEYQKELTTTVGTTIDLLKNVKVTDNSLEEIKATVEGDYDFNKEGTYNLKYVASDSSNNKKEEEFTLKVNKKEEKKTTTTNNKTTDNKNTQTNNTSNNNTSSKKVVKTETKNEKTSTNKYGITIENYDVYTVNTYSDGTTDQKKEYSYQKFDSSGFHATTSELLPEANQIVKSEPSSTYSSMLNILNGYRSEVGASPLELDQNLTVAATIRAIEIAYSGKFSHERPNMSGNTSCFTVLSDLNISRYAFGENIAAGWSTVSGTMDGWRKSQGHYENMINTSFKKVGFAFIKINGSKQTYYAVQIFSD